VKALGLSPGQQARIGSTGMLVLQLVVGTLNLTIGILAITYYTLDASSIGRTSSSGTFLQISIFAFIFGILSFVVACLGAVFNTRIGIYAPERREFQGYPAQAVTREYVTQERRTVMEQSYVVLACPRCGREVSDQDMFCDQCGARFELAGQTAEPELSQSLSKA
jgi:hypothetical protein